MKHASRLFGAFEYSEDQVITFHHGLFGFPEYTRFVIKKNARTGPVRWLLSVEEGGPEFPIVEPRQLNSRCTLKKSSLGRATLSKLRAHTADDLRMFAVVTTPENIRDISMNLRAPVLVNPKTRLGLQRQEQDIRARTVRRPIYRELTGDVADNTKGQLVILRKPNETIRIGDDIEIEVIALEDGGVRLGVSAPKDVRITRNRNEVSPELQMKEAAKDANVAAISDLIREYWAPEVAAV